VIDETGLPGFVGYDIAGHFLHYCHCGRWGAYGYGVFPEQGKLGEWFCDEHRPDAAIVRPRDDAVTTPPIPDTSPHRCAHCGGVLGIIMPIGVGPEHSWVHDTCVAAWRAARRAKP
jgi:hypothetical protein